MARIGKKHTDLRQIAAVLLYQRSFRVAAIAPGYDSA